MGVPHKKKFNTKLLAAKFMKPKTRIKKFYSTHFMMKSSSFWLEWYWIGGGTEQPFDESNLNILNKAVIKNFENCKTDLPVDLIWLNFWQIQNSDSHLSFLAETLLGITTTFLASSKFWKISKKNFYCQCIIIIPSVSIQFNNLFSLKFLNTRPSL